MSLASLLSDLEDDFQAAFHALLSNILSNGGRTLLAIAASAVTAVANDPSLLTNADKRSAAMSTAAAALAAAGIQAGESAISAAIEAAVSAMKGHTGPTSSDVNLTPTDALASLAQAGAPLLAALAIAGVKEGARSASARVTRKDS